MHIAGSRLISKPTHILNSGRNFRARLYLEVLYHHV